MKHKKTWLQAVLAIAIVGGLAGLSYLWNDAEGTWYMMLKKPVFQPPDRIFPFVWGALYLLTAVALFMLFRAGAGAGTLSAGFNPGLGGIVELCFFRPAKPGGGRGCFGLDRVGKHLCRMAELSHKTAVWLFDFAAFDLADLCPGAKLYHLHDKLSAPFHTEKNKAALRIKRRGEG